MSTYAIYRLSDGAIVSHFTGPPKQLERNTPKGCGAFEGAVDPQLFRIDPETLELVPLELQAPDYDVHAIALARENIARIEASQVRTIREALLGDPEAVERLRGQESAIAAERAVLQRYRPPSPSSEQVLVEPAKQIAE